MLARYKMFRGPRPDTDPLPHGIRMDTRKHTHHCLRPTAEMVLSYQSDPTSDSWEKFEQAYRAVLDSRFMDDRTPFDTLAETALQQNVFIGCSCPTGKNTDVYHCHTILALRFMQQHYPRLSVVFPSRPT